MTERDAEWNVLEPLLPKPKGFGRPRTVNLREILNAIFYVQRTGCQWELLPHDLPPHDTAYKYFRALAPQRNLARHTRYSAPSTKTKDGARR